MNMSLTRLQARAGIAPGPFGTHFNSSRLTPTGVAYALRVRGAKEAASEIGNDPLGNYCTYDEYLSENLSERFSYPCIPHLNTCNNVL